MQNQRHRTRSFLTILSLSALASAALACGEVQSNRQQGTVHSNDLEASSSLARVMNPRPEVATKSGIVAGQIRKGVQEFLGIPYAAAPVESLRFQPPQAIAPWTGKKAANKLGPICPQDADQKGFRGAEDCLYLNVWTQGASPKRSAPVMVFIHGGAFLRGSSTDFAGIELYIGDVLAKLGVVVVNFNYRLGILGFSAHPAMGAVNLGLRDQIAALDWVQANIAVFGGDPNNVTIFGESAGAMSVCSLVASPLAKGRFHRAIMQSGSCNNMPLETAQTNARDDARKLGCSHANPANELQCMATLPVHDILLGQRNMTVDENFAALPYVPVVDKNVLMDRPETTVAAGAHNKVPMIIGSNRVEIPDFMYMQKNKEKDWRATVRTAAISDESAAALGAYYSWRNFGSYAKAQAALHTDYSFTCSDRELALSLTRAQTEAVFTYNFNAGGAFHGAELPFVFGSAGPENAVLQELINQLWTSFAKTGQPTALTHLWPAFRNSLPLTFILDSQPRFVPHFQRPACDLLKRHAKPRF